MKVALFAEGRSDLAVIVNILKGALNIDKSDIRFELPEYDFDETDLYNQSIKKFSNWTLVKEHCLDRTKINTFLDNFEESRFIILQIDTAEKNEIGYEIKIPIKKDNLKEYSIKLRESVINKISEWLDYNYTNKIAYAISIEETEAWLLTQHIKEDIDTCKYNKAKEEFKQRIYKTYSKKKINESKNSNIYEEYLAHSKLFRKEKELLKLVTRSQSLNDFYSNLLKFKK